MLVQDTIMRRLVSIWSAQILCFESSARHSKFTASHVITFDAPAVSESCVADNNTFTLRRGVIISGSQNADMNVTRVH